MTFACSICSEAHDLAELSFGTDAPAQWDLLSDEERGRSELGSEQCVVDSDEGRHFFVRAWLQLPIRDTDHQFSWGVWVSLSEASFLAMMEHWEDPGRAAGRPYFGWLSTKIPGYADTMFLKTMVHQRPVGLRPLVVLEP